MGLEHRNKDFKENVEERWNRNKFFAIFLSNKVETWKSEPDYFRLKFKSPYVLAIISIVS